MNTQIGLSKLSRWVTLYLIWQLVLPLALLSPSSALAEEITPPPTATSPANLDLTSTAQSFNAPATMTPTNIVVGGQSVTVQPLQALTAAENIALQQVLTGGTQTLGLNNLGVAVAGSLSLTPALAASVNHLSFHKACKPILILHN